MKGRRFWGKLAICVLFCLLLSGCRKEEPVSTYAHLKEENVVTLADGTEIDCWENDFWQFYCLKDGTEILHLKPPSGPQGHYAVGAESFDDLSPNAQEAVADYYAKQGTLYDLPSELEAAYDEYLKKQTAKERYHARIVEQETAPTAAADDVIYFRTILTLPVGDQIVEQYSFCAAFDRQSGEKQDVWSLFTVPKEEVLDLFFTKNGITGEERQEMEEALREEWISFTTDSMGLDFPKGALSGEDHSLSIFLQYDQGLSTLFRPGALPRDKAEES